jgi:anti-sigma regulatory factor (Ser/Thr protein kinase)
MVSLRKNFFVKARDFVHAGEASISIQSLLKSMNHDPKLIRRIGVCSYEGEMNGVMHGGDTHVAFEMDSEQIVLEITDDGPGIEDIELAMQPGYSTASEEARELGFGAGMGLPNMKKNADQIFVASEKGKGTLVRVTFSLTPGEAGR